MEIKRGITISNDMATGVIIEGIDDSFHPFRFRLTPNIIADLQSFLTREFPPKKEK